MLAGPALSAFAIFHSSEGADVVNVSGGNTAIAEDRSSAKAVVEIVTNTIAAQRALLITRTSLFQMSFAVQRNVSAHQLIVCYHLRSTLRRLGSRRPKCHMNVNSGHSNAEKCVRLASSSIPATSQWG